MKSPFSFCISLLCFVFSANAQIEEETLFKINEQEYRVGEFIQSYQKNSDISSVASESVEEHLERFINFHLKLTSAYAIQLDTLSSFKQEFGRYYKQIADSYISNGEVTEAMVKETYDRTKTEVRASHILLSLPEYEDDTTEVYQQALMLKRRIEDGEPFEPLAKQYSDDPSVQANAGDMNWFNAFKMVYEFEDAAYRLEVGEVSNPVRSEFGYHIIKKTGERPSRGQLETAHIMLYPRDSLQDPETRIQKIYKRLQDGEDFHELAKQYSQDNNTASTGGYVPVFSLGGLNSKTYENKAYELENKGDYSEPFRTRFGWHIVKLIKTIPLQSYEEVKEDYKKKLKSSSRSKLLLTKIREDLENLYAVDIKEEAKDHFLALLDSSFTRGKWKYEPKENAASQYIIRLEDQRIDYKTFGEYLERQQFGFSDLPAPKVVIQKAIDDLLYSELLTYHKTRLPEIDKAFGERIKEYKQGILIFDYMQKKIWEPIVEDTILQKAYYNTHKKEFITPKLVKGQLYTSKNRKALESLAAELRNRSKDDTLAIELAENIILEQVNLEKSSPKLPANFKFKAGLSKIYKHSDQFLMMVVNTVEEPRIQDFDEVSGKIIGKLQEEKEEKVISELRENYKVVVNAEVFKKLKNKLEN